jgi:peptide/nickel transport system substrate-binding protein
MQPLSSTFRADIAGPLPTKFNSDTVRSAGQHLILAHLVRPLMRLNRNAQIEGDLAAAWEIKDDFKIYRFRISETAKWSDGSSLNADDLVRTFEHAKTVGSTTHFDFRQIESVRRDGLWFEIRLINSNPNILPQLVHPETAAAKPISADGCRDFSVASGPYSLISRTDQQIIMKRNPNYPWAKRGSPSEIYLTSSDSLGDQINSLVTDKLILFCLRLV